MQPRAPGAGGPETALRKLPAQQRSTIRVGRILDAAGDLVAEQGYEATTTTHIARRARVSPGSLYEFFSDKRSVMRALAARNLERYMSRLELEIAQQDLARWEDVVELALDLFVQMCREDAGFRVVRFGDVVDVHLLDPAADNDTYLAAELGRLLRARFGDGPPGPAPLALTMAIKIADALVQLAFALDPRGDERVLRRARILLRAHLEAALDEPGGNGHRVSLS
jgi:AcrR family transcriptional regulator